MQKGFPGELNPRPPDPKTIVVASVHLNFFAKEQLQGLELLTATTLLTNPDVMAAGKCVSKAKSPPILMSWRRASVCPCRPDFTT